MIEVRGLTKRYGPTTVLDDVSFTVRPGVVTGFLGANGAGKSTTMRLIVGLDRPNAGTATVAGREYCRLPAPTRQVGALLDANTAPGGFTARAHLRWQARAGGIPARRVDEVLEMVGLADAAGKRVGGFSLGMTQRLGLAAALLGDPPVLLLDEPVNGLDPAGIAWIRDLLRELAAQGRTILLSSHLMREMQATADHVLVIAHGRLVADADLTDLTDTAVSAVRVCTPRPAQLTALLSEAGAEVDTDPDGGALRVRRMPAAAIGDLAVSAGISLHELTTETTSLESAFMNLTRDITAPLEGSNQ